MIYHHPLAYLLGVEGLALLRAWAGEGDHDKPFVRRRIEAIRQLLADPELAAVPGVSVERDATASAYAQWAPSYDDPSNGLFAMDEPIIDEILDGLPVGNALDAACGTGRLMARLAARGFQMTGVDGRRKCSSWRGPGFPTASSLWAISRRCPCRTMRWIW